ncbi:MAG: CHAT domain-containing protein [Xanthobacteraceae bacterium]|nr:CHAT domain-containing protein [Xanthobacteraceae bacterium]
MRRRRPLACAILVLGVLMVAGARAQQIDLAAIWTRFFKFFDAGNYSAALVEAQSYEAGTKARFGTEHPNYADALNLIANVYEVTGRYPEAEELFQQELAILEKTKGPGSVPAAGALNNLAVVYDMQGKLDLAVAAYQRVLTMREKALGVNHPDVSDALNNLALVYKEQGRNSEAASLLQRALSIREKARGGNPVDLARILHSLGVIYMAQGKDSDAEGVLKRGIALTEKALGPNHPMVASFLGNLALTAVDQDKLDEAERDDRRALAIKEQTFGPNHPEVARTLNDLGLIERRERKYADADTLLGRALAIKEQALGPNHPDLASTINNLAANDQAQGHYDEAEGLYRRALSLWQSGLGANHPNVALALDNLANLQAEAGNTAQALAFSRQASADAVANAMQTSGPDADAFLAQRITYFRRYLANLALAAQKGVEPPPRLGREAFEAAQWASQTSAASALQQMAARFAAGSDRLAALVRESQDLAVRWRDQDKMLALALAKPGSRQDQAAISALRAKIADTETRAAAAKSELERSFPDYAALASPKPLALAEAQQLLKPNEALIAFAIGMTESYVFAATRDDFAWHTIPLDAQALAQRVTAFRRGLKVEGFSREPFDLGTAYDLYETLLGPVEALIADKPHLLIAASGALTALPFHLLVTKKPAAAIPPLSDPGALASYRDAAWLIKQHAISVLPSVASLRALRHFARSDEPRKPMIGFGDPIFDPKAGSGSGQRMASRALNDRGLSDFWQGVALDRGKLALLPRLEDTADELRAVGQSLGASESDIHLRADASVTTVKHAPLANYRIVYFATHGLVAGDIEGVAEPALALSIPAAPTVEDDGLLTASEVAQLKLDADWVVLSACNTVAGDKPGAEALSGLARAFFYAGARALLVTHWSVDSSAATRLTTATFAYLKADPTLGRAEALRRAMLDYMNDRNAYPGLWGPFEVVGEGAAP